MLLILRISEHQGMSSTILAIGLTSDLVRELVSTNGANIVTADSFQEATPLLMAADVSTILIDSRSSSRLRNDINMLLADTPVTTTIVLITHPSDLISAETYSALGVKTVQSPTSAEMINEALLA